MAGDLPDLPCHPTGRNWTVDERHAIVAYGNRCRATAAPVVVGDAKRLLWVSRNWSATVGDQYVAHVLRVGGTGDLSDIRSFIDLTAALAGD